MCIFSDIHYGWGIDYCKGIILFYFFDGSSSKSKNMVLQQSQNDKRATNPTKIVNGTLSIIWRWIWFTSNTYTCYLVGLVGTYPPYLQTSFMGISPEMNSLIWKMGEIRGTLFQRNPFTYQFALDFQSFSAAFLRSFPQPWPLGVAPLSWHVAKDGPGDQRKFDHESGRMGTF